MSFEVKFSYLKCAAFLSLLPILTPLRRRLVKLIPFFETFFSSIKSKIQSLRRGNGFK